LSACILDASALLAYLHGETGADEVAAALAETAVISAANWAETLSKLSDIGHAPSEVMARLRDEGVLGALLEVEPLTEDDAVTMAQLRSQTRAAGLGLGDRACLALGARLGLRIVTADRAWTALELGVSIQTIR
jgi:ribonuclease VapC